MLTGGANDLGTQNDHGLSISRAERNATFRVSRSRGNLADHFVGGQINPVQRVSPTAGSRLAIESQTRVSS